MNVLLNSETVQAGGHPAEVQIFTDAGSLLHFGLGYVAGSRAVLGKEAAMILAAFIGYQLSQVQSGEQWSRTGGEFLEFALGMLAGRLMDGDCKCT